LYWYKEAVNNDKAHCSSAKKAAKKKIEELSMKINKKDGEKN